VSAMPSRVRKLAEMLALMARVTDVKKRRKEVVGSNPMSRSEK